MVEALIAQIHARKQSEAAQRGEAWCGHWHCLPRPVGQPCPSCQRQDELHQEFWRLWGTTH
jgi:hypothetical protein